MAHLKSRKEVFNTLEILEKKHKIHEITRFGFPIYQMTKVPIMGNLINEKVKNPKSGYAYDKLKNVTATNTIKVRKKNYHNSKFNKTSVIFILRGLYNGEGKDNFLDAFITKESRTSKNIYIIDREMGGEYHQHNYLSEFTTKDFQSLIKYDIPKEFRLTEQELEKISKFSMDLRKLGYVGNYIKLFEHNLAKFYSEYTLYKIFVIKNNVKRIYLTLGYSHLPLIKVAKDLGIETIEVQYGNISPMHGGFGSWNDKELYSDILGVWSEYYAQSLYNNPSQKVRVIPANLKYPVVEKKAQLLVIVQRLEIDAFISLASLLRQKNEGMDIIFKFHPFHDVGKKIKNELKRLNIKIIVDEIATELLINESKWVLSGYSTALIEANYAKSIPLVSRSIPYSDEFIPFCDAGYMYIYNNDEITNYNECRPLSINEGEFSPKD